MSTVLRPVGPQPPQVYWTRRLVVFGVLFVIGVLIWSMLSRGGGDEPAAATGETPEVVDGTSETPAEQTDGAGRTCTAADLTLVVTVGAQTYPAGAQPVFSVVVTNTGGTSCTVDSSEATRELLVTSGSDRIWSSLDCPVEAAERLRLLQAGTSDEPATLTWPRIRSAEGCTDGLPEPRPGTYHVVAKLAGAESQSAVFNLAG